jgi:Predicted nucleic-acid-binding protein, contains PIN domain
VKEVFFIDTNVLLRFLLNDHQVLSPKAKLIFLKAQEGKIEIYLDEIVVAEAVWTLSSYYQIKKEKIIETLEKLISQNWIINPRKKLILETLLLYKSKNIHYIDAWIFIFNKNIKTKLFTFDKNLAKLTKKI